MKRLLGGLLALLLLTGGLSADCGFSDDNWVSNRGGGWCGWCSIEMVGRHLGISELDGLVDKLSARQPEGGTNFPAMHSYLVGKGLKTERQEVGKDKSGYMVRSSGAGAPREQYLRWSKELADAKVAELEEKEVGKVWIEKHAIADHQILVKAQERRLPVIIGYRGHAVVLTHLDVDKNEAWVRDPNDKKEQKRTLGWLLSQWTGEAIVLLPRKDDLPAVKPAADKDKTPDKDADAAKPRPKPRPRPKADPNEPEPEQIKPPRVKPANPHPGIRLLILRHTPEGMAHYDARLATQAVDAAAKLGYPIKVIGNHEASNPKADILKDWFKQKIILDAVPGDLLIVHTIGHGHPSGILSRLGTRPAVVKAFAEAAAECEQHVLWWQLSCFSCARLPDLTSLTEEQQEHFCCVNSSPADRSSAAGVQGPIMRRLFLALAQGSDKLDTNGDGVISAAELQAFLAKSGSKWTRFRSKDDLVIGPRWFW